ncbi:MAG TPA: hypothetical protein VGC41_15945 [Kofleriaceae bacterium]
MNHTDFSSWPREQEQSFVVYEQHAADSQKKAFTAGIIAAVGVLVLGLGIYAGFEPTKKDLGKDMNMSNLTKKQKTEAPAPTPAPAAAPAPATDKAAPAPAADDDKK